MNTAKQTIPPVPRGTDRRGSSRLNHSDWRVNQRSYDFLNFVFDPLNPVQTLARAKWMTAEHGFRYIVTPNVDHVVSRRSDPDLFDKIFGGSWLSVCDSRILELLAKMSGVPLKAVPGSDLTQQLFDNVISPSDPITVIGGDLTLVADLTAQYDLKRVYHHCPPMGLRNKPDAIAEAAQFIADHPARYILLCVGSPQQEMVARACLDRGDCVGLGLCVGASLDFITGRQSRAPKWMQSARLEWLYRLMTQPGRLWKRYLVKGPRVFSIWAGWALSRTR